jgi:hypothetical protein
MADDDRFASISEGEMDAIVENTGVKNLLWTTSPGIS